MQSKILSKPTLLFGILAGSVFILALFLNILITHNGSFSIIKNDTTLIPTQGQALSIPESPNYGLPMRLKIPAINVDSAVEYVGLTSGGEMDIPKSRDDVAWFNLGSRPGNNGSAIISGHYGWEKNKGSAFDNLHKLSKGDKIYIEDDKGATITFAVRESRRYDPQTKKTDNADIFGSADGKPHLNLITCEGVWDEKTQQYTKRLVVFADIETQI